MRKDAKITVIRVAFVEGRIDVISRLSAKSGRPRNIKSAGIFEEVVI